MSNVYGLWTQRNITFSDLMACLAGDQIDLKELFPNTYPILCSSGRAALSSVLECKKIKRSDYCGVHPYASWCIFDAVGAFTTPIHSNIEGINHTAHLVYHQWGWAHKVSAPEEIEKPSLIIEDSVDSYIQNSQALFTNRGDFEIISLSKLLGLPFGAILFCKNKDDYKAIMDSHKTNQYSAPLFRWALCGTRSRYYTTLWNKMESKNRGLGRVQKKIILNKLKLYHHVCEEVKEKLDILKPFLNKDFLSRLSEGRLPSSLPLECSEAARYQLKSIGFGMDERFYNMSFNQSSWQLKSVYNLPIHADVPIEKVKKAAQILSA